MLTSEQKRHQAYKYCMAIAQSHYENFPVASHLLNRQLRFPVSAVYAFARSADDFADEGNSTRQERLLSLDEYIVELKQIEQSLEKHSPLSKEIFFHDSHNAIFIALADVIHQFQIPVILFYNLIKAFKQDVNITRYKTFDDVLKYCRLSANPVGQILLYLNKSATRANMVNSDAICTGLQLINFYQDIAQDIDKNDRLYLPLEEMRHYNVSVSDIRNHTNNEQTQDLIKYQIQRAKLLYESGKPLCSNLTGRFAVEIRMIFAGGTLILNKLEENSASIYHRPRLNRIDKFKILWRGFFPSY